MTAVSKLSGYVLRFPSSRRNSLSDRRRSLSALSSRLAPVLAVAIVYTAWNAPTARAQVSFDSAQYTVNSGLDISGIALDGSGNIFVADFGNGDVREVLADSGSIPLKPTIKTLASGFSGTGYTGPGGVAVDANGNVFVTDPGNSAVKEILAVNGSIPPTPTIKTLGSGFGAPFGIAVDDSGNVYIADTGNNAVKEILAAGGYTTVNTLGGGFRSPSGVAVDTKGNVYVADTLNTAVKEILAVDGSIPTNPTIRTLAIGAAESVAVDGSGNVYYATASATDSVQEILAVDGSIPTNPTITTLGGGFESATSVAVDRRGDVLVVLDYANVDSGVVVVQTKSVDFPSVNVCPSGSNAPTPCSVTQTLTFNIAAGTTIGSIKVLTLGTPGLDFQAQASDTSTTLCKPQTYPSATTCTVDVTFAPLHAGERSGAVQIVDGSGNVLAATNIYGTGIAPAIAFTPASQSSLVGGAGFSFGQPAGVATDGAGNIFVADFTKKAVYEMLATGGFTTVKTLGGGFAFGGPSGVAVDGAGNVFVSDFTNKAVYEVPAAGGYTTVNTLAGSFTFGQPTDVAIDGAGNLFVSDLGSAVYEILAASGYTTVNPLASRFTFGEPSGLAVDGNDNVYVTDVSKIAVYEILAAGGYTTVNQLASSFGFKNLLGLAVGTNGNVFVADGDFTTIFEILAAGGYTTVLPLGSGFGSPQSVGLDASGNVYVPDTGVANTVPGSIHVIERSQPPALTFAATNVGETSSDSPKSVRFENIGNQSLTGSGALSDSLDFTVVAGPGTVPDCDGILSLGPGTLCNISFSFMPQSTGPLGATLTLSDNALNGNPATQKIQLSGSGQILQLSSISPNYGAPAALIQIAGTGFGATQGDSVVTVGGAPSHIVSWSNTAIAIQVPSRATTGNIVVTVGGVASNGEPFTFYTYPAITGISPLSGPIGTLVTITGTSLLDGGNKATVTFNGIPAAVLSDTSTSIMVDVPSGATTGPIDVRVNGIPLSSGTFTVTSSQLSISSISPNYGAPAALIQIAGNGFGATQGNSVVTVGGAPSHIVSWSNTAIAIQVPSRATTGNIVVTVGGVSSNGAAFTFYPYPAITGISPLSGPIGTPATITGTSLLDGGNKATVTFNGTPATVISDTSTSIMVDVPTGATTGPVDVRVNGIPLSSGTFTVTSSQLSISSISPNYGAPAALIQVAGTGFGATQGSSVVTVGGAPSYVASWSNTAISILVPTRATTGDIVVTVGGVSSNGEPFTFYPYPAITGISPLTGPVGTPVTITGTSLLDGGNKATVTFNGILAAVISDTSTTIMVDVPTGATTGPVDIRVNGIPINDVGTFTVTPSISIVPASANVAAGGSIQFTVSGGVGLTWRVNGIAGGDAAVGVISTAGLYTASQAAGTVAISAVDPSNPVTHGQASVSILAPHHFGVRTTSGLAQLYDRASGNVFIPRGNNYVRLATLTDPDGSPDYTHSTFSVGLYDSARAEAALTKMQASGYNVVRVFLWGCCEGTIGDPAGGLSSAYILNVVDFLQRAKAHAIGVIFTSQWLPVYGGYTDSLGACQPQFDDINLTNLSSCGVSATKKFFHDYVSALVNAGAPLDAIFAYDLWNEYYYNATAAPLNTTSGTVTTANGKTYDMSSAASQQQMMDDGLVYFVDQNRSAILAVDPTALVTMSFFTPQGPNPARIGDFRIIEVYPAVANSTLDYVDLHAYPIASGLTLDQFADNFGFVGYQQHKPILMGEFGAFTADYAPVTDAAAGLQGWQTQSCAYNFQGWLLWTWDTDEQTELWNALSQGGAINQSLSPAERPNPCSP